MPKQQSRDPRLVHLRGLCPALPETTRELKNEHAAFLVRKKTFAYYLNDPHDDGIVAVTCKVAPGDNAALAAAQPARVFLATSTNLESRHTRL